MRRSLLAMACVLVSTSPGIACEAVSAPTTEDARTGSSGQLLRYERSGGLAGRRATLVVARDRRVVARPGGRTLTLGAQEIRRLRADLKRADLARLPAENRAEEPVRDGFSYVIVAGDQRVVAESGAVPERLEPLLSRLNGLLRRMGVR